MKTEILIMMACVSLGFAGDGVSWLYLNQARDGLWHNSSGLDVWGSMLALQILDKGEEQNYKRAVQQGKSALSAIEGNELKAVVGRSFANASMDELSAYVDGGFIEEPGSFPDLQGTILSSLVLGTAFSDEWKEACMAFIEKSALGGLHWGTADESQTRLTLFSLLVLIQWTEDVSLVASIADVVKEIEPADTVELSLLLNILCACGDWQASFPLREQLLQLQNEDGSWGESFVGNGNVLATCLALQALGCFSVDRTKVAPDLDVPLDGIVLGSDTLSFLVFNNGKIGATPFDVQVSVYGKLGNKLLESNCHCQRLEAGNSCRIELLLQPSVEASFLVIVADCLYVTNDSKRENNIAIYPLIDEVVPYLSLSPLSGGGKKLENTLFLGVGHGISLTSAASISGLSADELVWKLRDNGQVICSQSGIDTFDYDWFPDAGTHQLLLEASVGTLQATCAANVLVVYEAAIMRSYSVRQSPPVQEDRFGGREYVEFEALSSWADCDVEIRIFDERGQIVGEAIKSMDRSSRWQWHTGIHEPGLYCAKARFKQKGSWLVLGTAECSFSIEARSVVGDLAILEPKISKPLYSGDTFILPWSLSWTCLSNVPVSAELEWQIVNEQDEPLEESIGSGHVVAELSHIEQISSFPLGIRGTLGKAGQYMLRAKLHYQDQELIAERPFTVINPPVINVSSSVMPEVIDKGPNIVRTRIVLSGEKDESIGKMMTFDVEDHPIYAVDAEQKPVSIKLSNIRDSNGMPVVQGTFYCSVIYGHFEGGNRMSAQGRPEGDYVEFKIDNGQAEVIYRPSGRGKIKQGDIGVIPIHVYAEEESESIGTIHVFLVEKL